MPRQKKLIGSNKALPNAPIRYKGKKIGHIEHVQVIGNQIVVTVKLTHCYSCGTKLINANDAQCAIGPYCPNKKCDVLDGVGLFDLKEVY